MVRTQKSEITMAYAFSITLVAGVKDRGFREIRRQASLMGLFRTVKFVAVANDSVNEPQRD
jgi:hypothetical protein